MYVGIKKTQKSKKIFPHLAQSSMHIYFLPTSIPTNPSFIVKKEDSPPPTNSFASLILLPVLLRYRAMNFWLRQEKTEWSNLDDMKKMKKREKMKKRCIYCTHTHMYTIFHIIIPE